MKKVEFFFDSGGATSYLAHTHLPKIAAVLREAGCDIDRMLAFVSDPAVKQQLKTNTDKRVERGVFGAPTFFVRDQMFFGQDRFEFVLQAAGQRCGITGAGSVPIGSAAMAPRGFPRMIPDIGPPRRVESPAHGRAESSPESNGYLRCTLDPGSLILGRSCRYE
jgi:hypothetical protein